MEYLPKPKDVVVRKPGKPWNSVEGFPVVVHRIDTRHSFFCFDLNGNMYHMFNDDVDFWYNLNDLISHMKACRDTV